MSDIDWKNPFRFEDFQCIPSNIGLSRWITDKDAVAYANRRFRELIEQCPVVYGKKVQDWLTCDPCWLMSDGSSETTDTHQARLICIEDLKK